MLAPLEMACVECAAPAEAGPSPLEDLPLDLHLAVMSLLDGQSLAAFAESTNRQLHVGFRGTLAPLWRSLHTRVAQDGAAPELRPDDATQKGDYVRAWAAAEARCPRCGIQSRAAERLDDYGWAQRHMCEWAGLSSARPKGGKRSPTRTSAGESPSQPVQGAAMVQTTLTSLWSRPVPAA